MIDLTDAFVELIRRAATELPADMQRALREAKAREAPGSAAEGALDTILQNVELARAKSTPICQDTGTPIFDVHYPVGVVHPPPGGARSGRRAPSPPSAPTCAPTPWTA